MSLRHQLRRFFNSGILKYSWNTCDATPELYIIRPQKAIAEQGHIRAAWKSKERVYKGSGIFWMTGGIGTSPLPGTFRSMVSLVAEREHLTILLGMDFIEDDAASTMEQKLFAISSCSEQTHDSHLQD
jgi:hypothetical protein